MRKLSYAEGIREAIAEEMRRDEKVFCIGEDIGVEGGFGGAFGVTQGLSEEFGHQRAKRDSFSYSMTVRTMRAGN